MSGSCSRGPGHGHVGRWRSTDTRTAVTDRDAKRGVHPNAVPAAAGTDSRSAATDDVEVTAAK
jgi:hypothetical protein